MNKDGSDEQGVCDILLEASRRVLRASDFGDMAGKAGVVLTIAGLAWIGIPHALVGVGLVLILVSILKGIR